MNIMSASLDRALNDVSLACIAAACSKTLREFSTRDGRFTGT